MTKWTVKTPVTAPLEMANCRKKAKGATIVLEHSTPNKESDVTISPDSLKKNGT